MTALQRRLRTLERASEATKTAQYRLNAARSLLRESRAWASYDTWFGGFFASVRKGESVRRATDGVRAVNYALTELSSELGRLDLTSIPLVELPRMLESVDIWLDNYGYDIVVQRRLARSAQGVEDVSRGLVQLQRELDASLRRERELLSALDG